MTKSQKYYESIRADRKAWAAEQVQECMNCGGTVRLEVHEIERRSHAAGRWGVRCNYLLVCQPCHAEDFATMDHAKQLALKAICDLESFDLYGWLLIKNPMGTASKRVTIAEVAYWVCDIEGVK